MPQIFQVLRCFKCLVFQVHQTKKSNKFACKMCGEKQTIKRHYGLGNGQECRIHVQKLNGIRGEIETLNEISSSNSDSDEETEPTKLFNKLNPLNVENNTSKVKSKWSNFVDDEKDEKEPNAEEPMFLGNTKVVFEVPAKRKKFRKPKAATNTQPKNIPWDKTPVLQNDIIPFTDNFFSGSKDLEIIDVNVENKPDKVATPLIDKDVTKENFKSIKMNKQSKWAQFSEHKDDENQLQNTTLKNIDNIKTIKSDWDQLTKKSSTLNEIEGLKENEDSQKSKQPASIFSTCDEIDLDSILDI